MSTPTKSAPAIVSNSSDHVVVGCKLPNGIKLELGVGTQGYRSVMLNGANTLVIQNVAGGYGLTNVPKDFWEAWKKKHQHFTMMKNEHVFAVDDVASAQAAGMERVANASGLEPLDPSKAPKEIHPDEEHLRRSSQAATLRRQQGAVLAHA